MRTIGIHYPKQGEMAFKDLGEPPALKPTEVLVRTRYSGITNGTERHALLAEHGWKVFPGAHGYQCVGTIERVGDAVTDFAEGDWVFFGQYLGHRGWHVVDVSMPNGTHLCQKLPDVADKKPFALLGVAGVGMRGVRRCRVQPADNVWVAGLGLIGQFAAQSARALGARVTVSDVDARRLSIAAELGAHRCLDAREPDLMDQLKAQGPYQRIFDCCGVRGLLDDIHRAQLVPHGGVIGLLAVRSETTFHWSMLHTTEASIEVSCHFSLDDLKVLIHFITEGIIRVDPLISHFVGIEEAPKIYETLRDRPGELLGVVFDWAD
ncbi:MAG: zinc-binding alcohol dehydrogenase [Phycisphaerae bacterium]|nr:zinc-binding alcohol dehydrogenase [Phycisphaerae bacterium]